LQLIRCAGHKAAPLSSVEECPKNNTTDNPAIMSAVGIPVAATKNSQFSASKFNQQGRLAPQKQQQQQQQQQQTPQAPTSTLSRAAAEEQLANAGAPLRSFGVHETFKWKSTPGGKNERTEAHPLLAALQHEGLSTDENFNTRGVYLETASNASPAPIGVQLTNVNGANLTKDRHANGQWSTLVLPPNSTKDFQHMNGGKGLLLAANELDEFGNVNVQSLAPADLLKQAETHEDYTDFTTGEPTHYIVKVDLSGFADPDSQQTVEQKMARTTQLGRLVFANAKAAFAKAPGVHSALFCLPQPTAEELAGYGAFPDILVSEDLVGKKRGRFSAVIPADHLRDAVEHYGRDVVSKAQPTNAHDHQIKVFRVGAHGSDHIGDIKNELGVAPSDLDRAKHSYSGVHLKLNYEIQHNGKPFGDN
jgi:hypothetical protein